jgi:hypothetical protein
MSAKHPTYPIDTFDKRLATFALLDLLTKLGLTSPRFWSPSRSRFYAGETVT